MNNSSFHFHMNIMDSETDPTSPTHTPHQDGEGFSGAHTSSRGARAQRSHSGVASNLPAPALSPSHPPHHPLSLVLARSQLCVEPTGTRNHRVCLCLCQKMVCTEQQERLGDPMMKISLQWPVRQNYTRFDRGGGCGSVAVAPYVWFHKSCRDVV